MAGQISSQNGICIISINAQDEPPETPNSPKSSPIKGIFRRQSRPMRKSAKALFQQFGVHRPSILTREVEVEEDKVKDDEEDEEEEKDNLVPFLFYSISYPRSIPPLIGYVIKSLFLCHEDVGYGKKRSNLLVNQRIPSQ
uniref:Uncharacterized protein n=1 Tax=Caenorhabditis japonica TaxID=281687 RepID=A0A8R1IDB7_CAEJA